eukprot:TCALIF_13392-PA protein Name:"Protein of unknown function" AED:0.19 eAED:0.21 QI:5/0/0/0.75/0.66/0.25/4/0/311
MPLAATDVADLAQAIRQLGGSAPATATPLEEAAATLAASAVSIKLPQFWTSNLELRHPNSAYHSNLTKFHYVAQALDNSTSAQVSALLLTPPLTDKYPTIKAALIKAYGRTQAEKDTDLNSDPSTLMRAIFFAQLPNDIQDISASTLATTLQTLANEADKVIASRKRRAPEFHQTVNATHPGNAASGRPGPRPSNPDLCYFHNHYGDQARNCKAGTCMDESVFPTSPRDKSLTRTADLIAANGSAIPTYGKRSLTLTFSRGQTYRQDFRIAQVNQPILGADFFIANWLALNSNSIIPMCPKDSAPMPSWLH